MSLVQSTPTIDVNIPRFNQSVVAALIALAFISQSSWPVALTAVLLTAAGLLGPRANLTARIYTAWIRDLVDPGGPSEVEAAGPPRFASRVGAVFTVAATVAFILGWTLAGWVLTGTVGALALLAATSRICVGCLIYERLVR